MDHEGDLTADGLPTSALSFVAPPGATPEWLSAEMAATHGPVDGQHSHSHPAYGSQGDDKNHDHLHAHSGDSHHGHDHSMKTPARAEPAADAADAADASAAGEGHEPWTAAGHPELGALLAAAYATVAEGGSLVAAAMETLGSPWGVEQRGDDWTLLSREGEVGTFSGDDGYGLAMDALRQQAFADEQQRPVLAETWRSDMAFEGVKTPDGRLIDPGGLAYRDTPMPMMLQTTTDMGHYGAVLAGTILSAGTQQQVAQGSGEYDDTEAGRYALQIVEARGRFGVSIDGMSPVDAEAEIECDDDGWCSVVGVIFHLLTIGGVTMTPWPAFPDAYIALEQRAQAAAGDPEPAPEGESGEPCAECVVPPAADPARARAAGGHVAAGKEDPAPAGKAATVPFTAAAVALLRQTGDAPPAEWYRPQGDGGSLVAAGDERLVPQDDAGHVAVPWTIEASGRVYGHVASWWTCHTAYQGSCVTPPRSRSGYAAFNLRPMECADGSMVSAGSISMGCGHADTNRPLTADEVRAHYDGGPRAVRVSTVAAGQDEHGPWIAGCVDPDRSEAELNRASTLNLSGDWREVWRNKGLDLVAVLAGVLVPGFPVRSALSAAGLVVSVEDETMALPSEALVASAADDANRIVALVAAGVVRRPWPWEPTLAAAMGRIDRLEERLAHAERVTSQLRPLAASAIADRVALARQPASNGSA